LLVCDVMGHGVRSALVTALVRAFTDELRAEALDPGALLTRLNQDLMGVLRRNGRLLFVTAAYVVIDTAAGVLRYGQAGHPTGFLRRPTGAVELLPAGGEVAGPALGLIDGFSYSAGAGAIAPGDLAVLFTDGIFEVMNAGSEEWGCERLRAELARTDLASGEELLTAAVAAAARFAAPRTFEDDVCVAALEARSPG
jgi:sigma-B regulation protein RsbU (phosphoserine phosphatase)